ncbi:hypothetical protein HMPREF1581_01422 [Gardnerella vaginalis JCP8108]|uniref:Uncharacterized protein n=1 Tax=Gardnerella vaginalis JCP8108 TaxID=1261066 RepID=S4HXU0_GARVA|nr:hypothetical protein HMPREF1581_01422 [Gardnerella vaginalis JCP8108]
MFYEEKSPATVEANNATNINEKIEKIAKPLLDGCDWKILHVKIDSHGVTASRA